MAKNIFPKRNYYDDEYFEFLYYFNFKHFKTIFSKFNKGNGEIRREMNKMRGVLKDINKVNEKFNKLKQGLINISQKNLVSLNNGISTMNNVFAILENNILDAENQEFFKKIMMKTANPFRKTNNSSTYQKQSELNNENNLNNVK